MKFEYEYRTKKNELKRGMISAANRDGVYVALKEMGIRPSRVEEAPGILNKLFGKGKRWIAILVLLVIAVPGVQVSVRNTSEEEITAALSRKIAVEPADGLEARQIKALVEGMKVELREFIKDGGLIKEYGAALVARQEQEIAYYTRAKNEIDQLKTNGASEDELYQVWEDRNNKLRSMGIKLVAFPAKRKFFKIPPCAERGKYDIICTRSPR